MADLTYDDVRRAAQDAVRELHAVVGGLRNNSEDIKRSIQSPQTQNNLQDLTTRLTNLQNQINIMDQTIRNQSNTIHVLNEVRQNVYDLHRRLSATESFMKYIYDYFTAQEAERAEREG